MHINPGHLTDEFVSHTFRKKEEKCEQIKNGMMEPPKRGVFEK